MYIAFIGYGWRRTFATYAEAVAYAASHGLPSAFVELNLRKRPKR